MFDAFGAAFETLVRKILYLTALSAVFMFASFAQASAWDDYKARFVSSDGAVIDSGNSGMSHSEGQGYALMFALMYGDKTVFDKVLSWSEHNLQDPKTGLFYWAYRRDGGDPVADHNNATDGDLFIAWALMRAGAKWRDPAYTKKGESLAQTISSLLVTNFGGFKVLLPGLNGFLYNDKVFLNPSYYIYPALKDLGAFTYMKLWGELASDSKSLMNLNRNFTVPLSPDWIKLMPDGSIITAEQWPARSSYDAIRVPLYLYWGDPDSPELKPWKDYFARFSPDNTPAWVNVVTGQSAEYAMTGGLRAVRDLVEGKFYKEPEIKSSDDYFNASLKMLCYAAWCDTH